MQEIGTLQVRVFTSRAEIPVMGATVLITRPTGRGKLELLSLQVTDPSGLTRPIQVETPPAQDSVRPGDDPRPFASCDVWAEQPGYAMLLVEGVQVFPNVLTIQPMELVPLSEGGSSLANTEVRDIPPQSL